MLLSATVTIKGFFYDIINLTSNIYSAKNLSRLFLMVKYLQLFYLGLIPCKAEQPLQGMELQEKEAQKD